MNRFSAALILFLVFPAIAGPQQSPAAPQGSAAPLDPVLTHRSPSKSAAVASIVTPAGRMKLDVVVTDSNGKPVSGLGPQDFKVLDDGKPRRILSFRSYDGVTVNPEPRVEVILVFDTANLPFQQVAFTRDEIAKFLRENGGHLAQPVSIMVLSDAGLRVQPRPSTDGNALVTVLDQIKGGIQTINAAEGAEGDLERFQLSVRQMTTIAENEASRPGRKLLIWVGPGWPMLNGDNFRFSEKDQRRFFDGIVELSTKLREARTVVYSVSPASSTMDSGKRALLYQDFLKGVKSARQADSGDLALKVLVTQSGGLILGPNNDLTGQIDQSVADANAFYTLTFDPPHAEQANDYHELSVQVDQPRLKARTNTAYYNQP